MTLLLVVSVSILMVSLGKGSMLMAYASETCVIRSPSERIMVWNHRTSFLRPLAYSWSMNKVPCYTYFERIITIPNFISKSFCFFQWNQYIKKLPNHLLTYSRFHREPLSNSLQTFLAHVPCSAVNGSWRIHLEKFLTIPFHTKKTHLKPISFMFFSSWVCT